MVARCHGTERIRAVCKKEEGQEGEEREGKEKEEVEDRVVSHLNYLNTVHLSPFVQYCRIVILC